MDDAFWKAKLLAFLHDPPDKALHIQQHGERARAFMRAAGLTAEDIEGAYRASDWTASAADRFPFPGYQESGLCSAFVGDDEHPFRHPMGGSDFVFDRPFASNALAEDVFQTTQKGIDASLLPEEDRARATFFLHWRRWPVESSQQDPRTAFLPADTRLPDHTIWCHNSVVSALEGCAIGGDKPAFLLVQLGPVQEFIAQARRTRDLWSGSYLIAWLMAHALKAVADAVGPDVVVFPSPRGQPLFDLMQTDLYDTLTLANESGGKDTLRERMKAHPNEYLTPALPNRFLALVPSRRGEELAGAAVKAIEDEVASIGRACWAWLDERHPMESRWRSRFDEQLKQFPQVQWWVEPWDATRVEADVAAYERLYDVPDKGAEELKKVYDLAKAVPEKTDYHLKDPGFCWPYYYARASRNFDGRRQLRDFNPWMADDEHKQGTRKDSLSGKEEIVGDEKWWKAIREGKEVKEELRYLFRSRDVLGAVNLVKRVWHRAYLEKERGLAVERALSFESVPGAAAGKWKQQIHERMKSDEDFCTYMLELIDVIREEAPKINLELKPVRESRDPEKWLSRNDPECFFETTWEGDAEKENPEGCAKVLGLLREKDDNGKRRLPAAPKYYAVIALDGDEMGKWVAGEKTPALLDQMSREARTYFEKLAHGSPRRPLSPSYHLQFSEALSNFATYLARPVVEHFGGQLIYAGGDDALAMVPASEAFQCARALHAAFRGAETLEKLCPGLFEVKGTKGGFVKLADPKAEQPKWPLIVPGPNAEVSAGIAVGHIHSPLQNLVRAAQAAEKRAKNKYERAAFAVDIYKRSGEIVEWGGKWDDGALDAYDTVAALRTGDLVSNRFAYALMEWLKPYAPSADCGGGIRDVDGFDFKTVIESELAHTLRQQVAEPKKENLKRGEIRHFRTCALAYLGKLSQADRALPDFVNLFAIAAFMERGE